MPANVEKALLHLNKVNLFLFFNAPISVNPRAPKLRDYTRTSGALGTSTVPCFAGISLTLNVAGATLGRDKAGIRLKNR